MELPPPTKVEPWRRPSQRQVPIEPVAPSDHHFPQLCKVALTEIRLPEAKEMIVKPIIIPSNKRVITVMSYKDGKFISRDIYEDGTELPDTQLPIIVKKPKYNSWASVLKREEGGVNYFDVEGK
jgi:hypothetical protein